MSAWNIEMLDDMTIETERHGSMLEVEVRAISGRVAYSNTFLAATTEAVRAAFGEAVESMKAGHVR